jgi:hypothetical protein
MTGPDRGPIEMDKASALHSMVVRVIVQVIVSLLEGIADLDKKARRRRCIPIFSSLTRSQERVR